MTSGNRWSLVKALAIVATVGAVAFALWWVGGGQMWWELFSDRKGLRQAVGSFGALAPAVFLALMVVQAVLAPLPAPALAVAGGYIFGTLGALSSPGQGQFREGRCAFSSRGHSAAGL